MSRPISPLDGRYAGAVGHLGEYFSEFALMRGRVDLEARYLLALAGTGLVPLLEPDERLRVERAAAAFGEREFARVKEIEGRTRHDVKAVETFLRESLGLRHPDLVHFGLTSEDVNNLAYSTELVRFRDREQSPALDAILGVLRDLIGRWRDRPLPARTHGQLASPTTAGKEMAVFAARLLRQRRRLRALRLCGKLNGATGNYSALWAAFPDHDWPAFAQRFVESLGLEFNGVTTQVEGHDSWAEYFDVTRRIGNIVLDLDVDVWLYLSHGYLRSKPRHDEVGSSTMPHKVNPIRFENSEGNLELANGLLVTLSNRLTRSRLQRDLSDSTLERNIGVALSHSLLGLQEARAGLSDVALDEECCRAVLEGAPELLAEPFQTLARTADVEDPYGSLRALTRGRDVSREDLVRWLDALPLEEEVRARVRRLTVAEYVGLAPRICDQVLSDLDGELGR